MSFLAEPGDIIREVRKSYKTGWAGSQEDKQKFPDGKGYIYKDGLWRVEDKFRVIKENGFFDGGIDVYHDDRLAFVMKYAGVYNERCSNMIRRQLLAPGPYDFFGLRGEPTRKLSNGFHYVNRVDGNMEGGFRLEELIFDPSQAYVSGMQALGCMVKYY